MMTMHIEKATEILKSLSDHYEQTKDSATAEKIILLVEREIISSYRNAVIEEEMAIAKTFNFLFLKRRAMEKSDFRVYRKLKLERDNKQMDKEAERLDGVYSIEVESPTQKKEKEEAVQEKVYKAVKNELPYVARSICIADRNLQEIISSMPIMNNMSYDDILSVSCILEDIARTVLHISQCDSKGKMTKDTIDLKDGYVEFLSNRFTLKKMTHRLNSPTGESDEQLKELLGYRARVRLRNQRFTLLSEILSERTEQITKHGYSETHDDEHADGSIADAAAHYASTKGDTGLWPWSDEDDKKGTKSRREQLVSSIAMLISEVERIDRASAKEELASQPS